MSMPICIYCLSDKTTEKFNVEHVIPKAFGTFGGGTPTLIHDVCKDCNDYFGRMLDPVLSRDTYEGITRYPLGMKSREARPQPKLRISMPDTEETGNFRGMRFWINGEKNGLEIYNQVGFIEQKTGKRIFFTEDELDSLVLNERGLSDKDIRVIGRSNEEHDALVTKLIGSGIIEKYNIKDTFTGEPLSKPIHPYIEGTIDDLVKRALAKIAFNFSAKFIGKDVVSEKQWNPIREYIRHGKGKLMMRVRTGEPFWDNESKNWRFGHNQNPNLIYNIRIENQPIGVVARMEFFHLFLYEIVLVQGGSIPDDKEVGRAFIPGKDPIRSIKLPFNPFA